MVSPTWANATNVLQWFFLPGESRVQLLNIEAYQYHQRELTNEILLVMTPAEYERARQDPKFTDIRVNRVIPYPDGRTGFYFVQLDYSPQAAEIFAQEDAARRQPVREEITLDNQPVSVLHSQLDRGRLVDIFDGDPYTLIRTLVDNPAVLEFEFAEPRRLSGLSLTTATMDFNLTATLYPADGGTPQVMTRDFIQNGPDPTIDLSFEPAPQSPTKKVRLEIEFLKPPTDVHVHIRELQLR
jgi:hypothetical protein